MIKLKSKILKKAKSKVVIFAMCFSINIPNILPTSLKYKNKIYFY